MRCYIENKQLLLTFLVFTITFLTIMKSYLKDFKKNYEHSLLR